MPPKVNSVTPMTALRIRKITGAIKGLMTVLISYDLH